RAGGDVFDEESRQREGVQHALQVRAECVEVSVEHVERVAEYEARRVQLVESLEPRGRQRLVELPKPVERIARGVRAGLHDELLPWCAARVARASGTSKRARIMARR